MNSRKWRNPYTPLAKKTNQTASAPSAAASLSLAPKKSLPTLDLRSSVSRMRNNIKGISSTIRQMEETMDTLYGAMEMVESLGRQGGKPSLEQPRTSGGKRNTEEPPQEESAADRTSNPLANIDMGQLMNLLQSPLVQSLLSQHTGGSASQRKKEG